MIQSLEDALVSISIGEGENDILNEVGTKSSNVKTEHTLICISKLALNADKSNLAFTLDTGVVGVVDLANSNTITRMDEKHDSVSSTWPIHSCFMSSEIHTIGLWFC